MNESALYYSFEVVKLIGIIFAFRAFIINKKTLYLSTINNCVNQFRQIPSIRKADSNTEDLNKYIDLVNMELFYFQYHYLPKEICDEWLDGIINVMPICDRRGKVLNSRYVNQALVTNRIALLADFPRVRKVFTVSQRYDFDIIYSTDYKDIRQRQILRRAMILELMGNLKLYRWFDFEYKRKVMNFI